MKIGTIIIIPIGDSSPTSEPTNEIWHDYHSSSDYCTSELSNFSTSIIPTQRLCEQGGTDTELNQPTPWS
jgi:hypothetical protein